MTTFHFEREWCALMLSMHLYIFLDFELRTQCILNLNREHINLAQASTFEDNAYKGIQMVDLRS